MIDQLEPDFRDIERERDLPPDEPYQEWDLGDLADREETEEWPATR